MKTITIPLLGSMLRRGVGAIYDQYYQDWIIDRPQNPDNDRATAFLRRRPGVQVYIVGTPPAGAPTGVVFVSETDTQDDPDVIMSWLNGSTYGLYFYDASADTYTAVGSGTVTTTHEVEWITETSISGTTTLTYTAPGANKAYHSTVSGGSFTEITDADFPANASQTIVGQIVHKDGFASVMTRSGRLYTSDQNSVAAWTANSYITANISPDDGVGAFPYGQYIALFSRASIQFARNAGNPTGSPFSLMQESSTIGVAQADHVTQFGDTLAFIGQGKPGLGVYVLDGFSPRKISTEFVDRVLSSALRINDLTNMRITSCTLNGVPAIVLVGTSQAYVYQPAVNVWWAAGGQLAQVRRETNGGAGLPIVGSEQLLGTGSVDRISDTYTSDLKFAAVGPVAIQPFFRVGPIDGGTMNNKQWHMLQVIGDTEASATNLNVSWLFDESGAFSSSRPIDLASRSKRLRAIGFGRSITLNVQLAESLTAQARLRAIVLGYTDGAL